MKKKLLFSALGFVVIIASIWGGAVGDHFAPDWAKFASFSTAFIFFVLGFILMLSPFCSCD